VRVGAPLFHDVVVTCATGVDESGPIRRGALDAVRTVAVGARGSLSVHVEIGS
jgi:hypothetical protein